MANTYKGILTNNGKALIANATVSNKINYSHIAVGDGNGSVPTPSETRPTLINEKARIALNVVEINPNNTNQIVCEAIIPTNTGGFYIRELGLYAGNTMIVNASYPPTYKPLADEGGAREIAIKIVINIQNAEVIALYLDDSLIYATREWVNTNYIRRNEIVDNLITDASNRPVSAKQGKYLEDNKLDKTANAVSASKLKDARKINNIDFDGTKDISISAPMRYLGTVNSSTINDAINDGFYLVSDDYSIAGLYGYGILEVRRTGRTVQQTYFAHMGDFRVAVRQTWDEGQNYTSWLILGSRATTATKLETPRTVSFSGAATGSFPYDGSANSSCILTLSNSGVVAGTYASTFQIPSITVNEKGQITGISQQTIRSASATQAGIVQLNNTLTSNSTDQALTAAQGKKLQDEKFAKTGGEISSSVQLTSDNSVLTVGNNYDIGFLKKSGFKGAIVVGKNNSFTVVQSSSLTISKDASDTFTTLMILDGNGVLSSVGGYLGNSSSSSKLQTARKIFGQNFDGTNDVSGNLTADTGMLLADSYHYIDMGRAGSDRMNFNVYSGVFNFVNAQNGNIVARLDSNGIDCNAATASKLKNPRRINDAIFDGTGDINISARMRELITTHPDQGLEDGFYVCGDVNIVGLYPYGILETRRGANGTINQTYFAHQKNNNGSVAVRQSWNGGQNFTEWRSLDPQGSVTLSGQLSGSASFDDSGNINISASVVQGLGINQTWRNVTSQRAANTTYTNNRSVPIKVAIYLEAGGNNAYANISVGGEFLFAFSNTTAWGTSRGGEITVPPYTTYRVDGTFTKWSELT
ncbi:phage tail protein [Acinetobacter bereziniae]|uniref:phage tail protein n=1 Tax=Acinetobacter bereziniae TaxID=106648 RepID=UPI0022EAA218|nr:phage tail protein [Acinetobacter bereziniae]MDA3440023.1 phage tail protein [Acinetobacter bereziniae]